eukprot:ANDGO_06008.mRNA.1 hypothetical protein H257_02968
MEGGVSEYNRMFDLSDRLRRLQANLEEAESILHKPTTSDGSSFAQYESSGVPSSTSHNFESLPYTQQEHEQARDRHPGSNSAVGIQSLGTHSNGYSEGNYAAEALPQEPLPSDLPTFDASESYGAALHERHATSDRKLTGGTAEKNFSQSGRSMNFDSQSMLPFHERLRLWQVQKDRQRDQRHRDVQQQELEGCTFRPRINPNSQSLLQEKRDHGENIAMQMSSRKSRIQEEIRRQEEEEFRKSCTFRPHLVETKITKQAKPRYMSPGTGHADGRSSQSARSPPSLFGSHRSASSMFDGDGNVDFGTSSSSRSRSGARASGTDCTFTPQINKPKGKHVSQYLEQPAFLRLSRPSSAPPKRPVQNEARDANCESPSDQDGSPKPAFEEFLERQRAHTKHQQEKVELMRSMKSETFQPSISKKSVEILQKSGMGDFFRRQQRNAESKAPVSGVPENSSAPDITFQPRINPQSAKLRSRTVDELCYGDMMRKQAQMEAMKMMAEQKELENLTFRPALANSKVNERSKSRLRVLSEPESYTQRLREEQRARQQKFETAQRERELSELSSCTFRPEIHDAPDYVKRIARSMAIVKGQKSKSPTSEKEWR